MAVTGALAAKGKRKMLAQVPGGFVKSQRRISGLHSKMFNNWLAGRTG
jgi:hypothetical protein